MTARPRILIPARFSDSASALRYRAEVTSRALVEAVWAAGGEPLMIHPATGTDAEIAERLALADGVLLPGGGDLAAQWTGQEHHPTMYDIDEVQDAFDLAVARVVLGQGLPLLAVCRGLQVVNALLGGTVVQDMDSTYGEARHHRHRAHEVKVEAGTRLAGIVGELVDVSCYHHQCIDRPGEGLRVIATADDGVVEAVDLDGAKGWFLGVQWHPEDTWSTNASQLAVFRALVEAAR
ncbi:gamma-glutamyl-gamma-aminobutyrate hydrolase family protein [Nocardioides nematodiphilus]|uniref:gamma-glutamyl-gamma-aminobutyrate hydrolase family protein n=1 Tax=Nocardioides nematodiphilus TaxID=2849669 RepID=UPI001CDA34EB|nr:gamma-glutamyl-gamma-aminobutyrate hydrolase family protein [Nocardioides nematodiphilus]MCA1984262.1 gamma-glutamyl-gamma-aminobutyrate hydrolase family protein [Nocardioides nematodiphilus]